MDEPTKRKELLELITRARASTLEAKLELDADNLRLIRARDLEHTDMETSRLLDMVDVLLANAERRMLW